MNRLFQKAFTLIELLVVIVIIGILSGLIIVSLNNATNSANDAKRRTGIDTIKKALIVYGTFNNQTYPIELAGCNVGPVGIVNRCTTFSTALAELLPSIPVDPVSGYYTYFSNGTSFTLSSVLSSGKSYSYNSSTGYHSSVIARSSVYKPKVIVGEGWETSNLSNVDDTANGASKGYVVNFRNGWVGYSDISQSAGFAPGTYDVYMRLRTDGLGTNPTSLPYYVYDQTTTGWLISMTITGLTSSYQFKYIGRFTITDAIKNDEIHSVFSLSGITTNYYIDYIEFRPVI